MGGEGALIKSKCLKEACALLILLQMLCSWLNVTDRQLESKLVPINLYKSPTYNKKKKAKLHFRPITRFALRRLILFIRVILYGKVSSTGKENFDNRQQKLFLTLWKIPFYFWAAKTNLVQDYKQVPPIICSNIISQNMLFFKYLWWVGPSHQLNAHSHAHTPCSVGKKKNWKRKASSWVKIRTV